MILAEIADRLRQLQEKSLNGGTSVFISFAEKAIMYFVETAATTTH